MNDHDNTHYSENRRASQRTNLDDWNVFAVLRFGESLITCWVTNRADHGLGFWTPIAIPVGEQVVVEGIQRDGEFNPIDCRVVWAREDTIRGGFLAGGIILTEQTDCTAA